MKNHHSLLEKPTLTWLKGHDLYQWIYFYAG